MKLALHGYGKMGHAVEKVAKEAGHEIVDADSADALIDFSSAAGADQAVTIACDHRINLVIGSTGWNDRLHDLRRKNEKTAIRCVDAFDLSPGADAGVALGRRAREAF